MAKLRPLVSKTGNTGELVDADSLLLPSATFLDDNILTSKFMVGKPMLDLANVADGGMIPGILQNALWKNRLYFCQAMGGSSTSVDTTGYAAPANNGATATGRALAATNYFTRQRRVGYVSAATAGSIVSSRYGSLAIASLGNGAGLGGFFSVLRFGCSDAATVSGARMFAGATTSGGNPTNVEPSTLTTCIGVGHGASDTNLKLFYGGSTAQTPIDLGANFPVNTLSTDVYELILHSPSSLDTTMYWQVTRLNTGDVASGSIVGTSSVNFPVNSAFWVPWIVWRSNNATALAVGIDFMLAYVDTGGF